MAKFVAFLFATLFALTAGLLGLAILAIGIVVFTIPGFQDRLPLTKIIPVQHRADDNKATAVVSTVDAARLRQLDGPVPLQAPTRHLRDPEVRPSALTTSPIPLLPVLAGQTITPVANSITGPGPSSIITFSLAQIPGQPQVTVTAELQVDSLSTDTNESVQFQADSPTNSITVHRPGTYRLVASFGDTQMTPAEVTVVGNASPVIEIESIQFEFGGETFLVPSQHARAPVLLPANASNLVVEVKNQPGRLALWGTSDGKQVELAVSEPDAADRKQVTLAALPADGAYELSIVDLWSRGQRQYRIARIGDPSTLRRPQVTAVSNHIAVAQTAIPSDEVSIYENYIRLRGQDLPSLGDLTFLHFARTGGSGSFEFIGRATGQVRREENTFWNTELQLPVGKPEHDNSRLFVQLKSGQSFSYGDFPLKLLLDPARLDNSAIPAVTDLSERKTGGSKVTISGTHQLSTPNGYRVVATSNNTAIAAWSEPLTTGNPWTIDLERLTPGDHDFRFAFALGGRTSPARTEPVTVRVRTDGPKVLGVDPPNFGTAPGVQELVIRFDPANVLDQTRAEETKNYVLIGSGGTGAFSRSAGARFRPTDANLDPVSNAVTLVFDPIPADLYQLRINAHETGIDPIFKVDADGGGSLSGELGVRDQFENSLHGSSGPGTDYVHKMSSIPSVGSDDQFGLAGRLSDVAGIPETTGPPVDYPEYTDPRSYAEGFNPSDKVVTRVARLYYFRDAHRVAQIINRRSQSYNRHNTTMSRQLADQARIFAQETVDERRAAEREAVEAASQARKAENSLATLQNALVQARNDASRVDELTEQQRRLIRNREDDLNSAETTLANSHESEEDQAAAQASRDAAKRSLDEARDELRRLESQQQDANAQVTLNEQRINATLATIEALREKEVADREAMDRAQAKEDRAVDRQFRLEVAAAKEDPDTYAAGDPKSDDPVAQVSLSVIGEGVIQLRGPLKGVNIVRTIINQIDSPVGQVRVGVHTVQVNGERGDRMEEVVGQIQRYIDHSRFLTSQSAQMLRNAVVYVASVRAQQVCAGAPALTQEMRDLKYAESFFGQEFISELREMDSEFLKTGNKLLSLHSMDSTSLASALFLLGLASNDTRQEILQVFQASLQGKLPVDEMEYFEASDAGEKRKFELFRPGHRRTKPFRLLADNAKFVSFRGYFDHDVVGPETLNPVQREFIRLAQIFKSRLITEIELKQRVMERALIEERIGDYQAQMKEAARIERRAQQALKDQQSDLREGQLKVLQVVREVAAWAESFRSRSASLKTKFDEVLDLDRLVQSATANALRLITNRTQVDVSRLPSEIAKDANRILESVKSGDIDACYRLLYKLPVTLTDLGAWDFTFKDIYKATHTEFEVTFPDNTILRFKLKKQCGDVPESAKSEVDFVEFNERGQIGDPDEGKRELRRRLNEIIDSINLAHQLSRQLAQGDSAEADLNSQVEATETLSETIEELSDPLRAFFQTYHIAWKALSSLEIPTDRAMEIRNEIEGIQLLLSGIAPDVDRAHLLWTKLRYVLEDELRGEAKQHFEHHRQEMDDAFQGLLESHLLVQFAQADAEAARRPLDHKKFLDLLVDETEEKFIELVEGTRAHTAVMDDYIKRLATALEDDFNTQFYEPAFRNVREQTYSCWDVQLGQIEHTTVLTNNREFAKVLPQATMEFDLPKRDTVLNEALSAAQAAYSDYGALLADPNFLALTKMYSGQPTSTPFSSNGTTPLVRDVLPGLPSQTDESLLIQAETGQPEFASQLEALIPDPAIYKFETGTGYEIRPVIQPDGQSVVFDFNYMYTTNIREPVRADEKHLGRIKRHFVDTDVQIGNYELREVSRYRVALKASRTSRGIPLLEDVPVAGALFRPLPQAESSLQQNIILAHTVIYPTLFDLMGLRWAPAVADLDAHRLMEEEFVFRKRMQLLKNEVYDYSSFQVDEFLRVPDGQRRADLYRPQEPIPRVHPNGYNGPGLDRFDSPLQENYTPSGAPSGGEITPLVPVNPSAIGSGTGSDSDPQTSIESPTDSTRSDVARPPSPKGTTSSSDADSAVKPGNADQSDNERLPPPPALLPPSPESGGAAAPAIPDRPLGGAPWWKGMTTPDFRTSPVRNDPPARKRVHLLGGPDAITSGVNDRTTSERKNPWARFKRAWDRKRSGAGVKIVPASGKTP